MGLSEVNNTADGWFDAKQELSEPVQAVNPAVTASYKPGDTCFIPNDQQRRGKDK